MASVSFRKKSGNIILWFLLLLFALIPAILKAQLIEHNGFPVLQNEIPSKVFSAATCFDYDRDGDVEIIVGSGSLDNNEQGGLYVINPQGNIELYYPCGSAVHGIQAAPSVADIDNDSRYEIVFAGYGPMDMPYLFAIKPDGSNQPGFPVALDQLCDGSGLGSPITVSVP